MVRPPLFSLIVPTRQRPELLRTFLASVAATAAAPETVEVVLVVDGDDPVSQAISCPQLRCRHILVAPGQTMGALNAAGYEASMGRYLMLLNDDVIVRTPGWDRIFRRCFERCPDEVLLLHVNDLLFERTQCTFPVVSRVFCELAGGICPTEYQRYRIDDHIEDVFNLLIALGVRRTIYLPDVVFEHGNYQTEAGGRRLYRCDAEVLGRDAALFDDLWPQRKELALTLRGLLPGKPSADGRTRLDALSDPFALRTPSRFRVVRGAGYTFREESTVEAWVRHIGSRLGRRLLARRASAGEGQEPALARRANRPQLPKAG